jgi:hypothetical protein
LIVSHPNDPQHRHLSPADGIRRPFPARARNNRQRPPASRPPGEEDQPGVADKAETPTAVNMNEPPPLKPSAAMNKPPVWRPRPTRSRRQTVVGFVAGLALMACVYAGFAALTDDRPEQNQRPNAALPAPAAPIVPTPSAKPPQSTSPASRVPSDRPAGRPPAGPASSAVSPTLEQTPVAATAAVTTKTKKPKKPKKSKAPNLVDAGVSATN